MQGKNKLIRVNGTPNFNLTFLRNCLCKIFFSKYAIYVGHIDVYW